MGTPSGVEDDLGWALGAIMRSYGRAAREVVCEVPGGPRGYLVLAAAAEGGPSSQLALAQRVGVDRTAMTYLLDDLEHAGLVERRPDPADRRARRVVLTDAGAARVRALEAGLHEVEDRLLAPLAPDERGVLRGLLRRLATHAPSADACGSAPECPSGAEPAAARTRRRRAAVDFRTR